MHWHLFLFTWYVKLVCAVGNLYSAWGHFLELASFHSAVVSSITLTTHYKSPSLPLCPPSPWCFVLFHILQSSYSYKSCLGVNFQFYFLFSTLECASFVRILEQCVTQRNVQKVFFGGCWKWGISNVFSWETQICTLIYKVWLLFSFKWKSKKIRAWDIQEKLTSFF